MKKNKKLWPLSNSTRMEHMRIGFRFPTSLLFSKRPIRIINSIRFQMMSLDMNVTPNRGRHDVQSEKEEFKDPRRCSVADYRMMTNIVRKKTKAGDSMAYN